MPRLSRLFAAFLVLALAGSALLAAWIALLAGAAPDVRDLRALRLERPSVVLSADGQVLARFQRINRQWVGLEDVAQPVIDALLATEDRRFYAHRGIDLRRSLVAAGMSLAGERQGGSTLTQQLARNLFPRQVGRAPTLTRKLKEAITALRLERAYSKREILEIYLNTAPFLYNVSGIEMAAQTYFDTSAARLDAAQAATLVAMLKGTAAYNPVRNPERALARRNLVLAQMADEGRLARADYEALRARPLGLAFAPQEAPATAPHFAEQVRRVLADWAEREGRDLYADGLVIETTLDTRLQTLAAEAVARQLDALQTVADVEWARSSGRLLSTRIDAYAKARPRLPAFAHFWDSQPGLLDTFVRESPEFAARLDAGEDPATALAGQRADDEFMARLKADKTRLQAGFVVLDAASGEVRAWVGSRDYASDRYDHVAQARRQPGSTFKVFVYAAALEAGMTGERLLVDAPVAIRVAGGRWWQPADPAASGALVRLDDGLIHSRNSITAQLIAEIGAPRVAELARAAGVRESPLDAVPSLALGTSPVSLLEMAAGYATVARRGAYLPPTLVSRVLDRDGRVLLRARAAPEPALSPDTAAQLLEMLRAVVDRGTGRGLRPRFGLAADLAGKTGTSQNNADGWFVLMHPQLVAGAWVGFNDQRVRMRSDHWGQGAHTALYVAGDFFQRALAVGAVNTAARFPRWLPPPPPPPLFAEEAAPEDEAGMAAGLPPGSGAGTATEPQPTPWFAEDGARQTAAGTDAGAPSPPAPPEGGDGRDEAEGADQAGRPPADMGEWGEGADDAPAAAPDGRVEPGRRIASPLPPTTIVIPPGLAVPEAGPPDGRREADTTAGGGAPGQGAREASLPAAGPQAEGLAPPDAAGEAAPRGAPPGWRE